MPDITPPPPAPTEPENSKSKYLTSTVVPDTRGLLLLSVKEVLDTVYSEGFWAMPP